MLKGSPFETVPFSLDDNPHREFFNYHDEQKESVSSLSCRIRKSYAQKRGYTEYHYDCGKGIDSSDDIFEDSFFEQEPVKRTVFEEKKRDSMERSFSKGAEGVNYEDIFLELEDVGKIDHFSDKQGCRLRRINNDLDLAFLLESRPKILNVRIKKVKKEESLIKPEDFPRNNLISEKKESESFSEMFNSPNSEDFIHNIPSPSSQDIFQNGGEYFGYPIYDRRICHSRDASDIFSNDLIDEDLVKVSLEPEITLEQGALDSLFDFFEDLMEQDDVRFSFAVSEQEKKEENYITLVQRIQLEWSKELSKLCHIAKNLYNYANYYARKQFFYKQGKINELGKARGKKLRNMVKFSEHYKNLPAQTADQVLRYLIRNWKSYIETVRKWYQDPS